MTRRDAPQRIRQAFARAAGGLSVRELARATDLHENAVRRSLARLVAEGAISIERQPSHARGRPLLRYRLVGPVDEPFKELVPLLLGLLDSGGDSAEAAYAAGRAHGESTRAAGPGAAREAVPASLATLGFAPVERPSGHSGSVTLDLTRCPFADSVTTSVNGRTICHLHHGLLAGVARANGGALEEFVINDPRILPCRVAFRPVAAEEAAAR
jgi:predicted ArsR family transcriptional regulator